MLYKIFKSWAFLQDPEFVHNISLKMISAFPKALSVPFKFKKSDKYSVGVGANIWSFPVGLAAGLDKNGVAIDFFTNIGFGAIEVGTITKLSQSGNPRPRLFRLLKEESILNRMGFNNGGMQKCFENILKSKESERTLGINLGKNKDTSLENAKIDYFDLYKKLSPLADYLVINVSSPNTPGLRDLGKSKALRDILDQLDELRVDGKDLFVKVSPDMNNEDLSEIVNLAKEKKLTGIIATNTTIIPDIGVGGVSGKLLKEKSKSIRNYLLKETKYTNLELIGVGGIDCFEDLLEFWKNGGKVVQIYSSFIYKGPEILSEIRKGIDKYMLENNFESVEEIISSF